MNGGIGLAALVSPESVERFLATAWARGPFIARAERPDRFDSLFGIAEFEFLAGTVAAPGWLSFVKDAVQPPGREQLTSDGTLDAAALYKSVAEGKSLLLTRVHRLHAATGTLCRRITADFRDAGIVLRKPVRANAYFTPPSARGFDAHYDDHDVLVLQLAGSKRWRVYGEAVKWPRKPMNPSLPAGSFGPNAQELTLQTGDVLYLPRGFAHEAASADEASLHLTLSIQAATWSDVFQRLVDLHDPLGEPLPAGFAAGGVARPTDRARAADLINAMIRSPALERAIQDIFNSTMLEGDLPSSALLARLGGVTVAPDTVLSAVETLSARMEEQGDVVVLRLPGAALRADRVAIPLFQRVCGGGPFRLSDLGANAAALIELAEELVRRGVLVLVPR